MCAATDAVLTPPPPPPADDDDENDADENDADTEDENEEEEVPRVPLSLAAVRPAMARSAAELDSGRADFAANDA